MQINFSLPFFTVENCHGDKSHNDIVQKIFVHTTFVLTLDVFTVKVTFASVKTKIIILNQHI